MDNNKEFLFDIGDIVELRRRPGQLFEIIARKKTEEKVIDLFTNEERRSVYISYVVQKLGSDDLSGQGEYLQNGLRLVKRASVFFEDNRSIIDRALDRLSILDEMYKVFGDRKYKKLKEYLLYALKTNDENFIKEMLEEIEFYDRGDH